MSTYLVPIEPGTRSRVYLQPGDSIIVKCPRDGYKRIDCKALSRTVTAGAVAKKANHEEHHFRAARFGRGQLDFEFVLPGAGFASAAVSTLDVYVGSPVSP